MRRTGWWWAGWLLGVALLVGFPVFVRADATPTPPTPAPAAWVITPVRAVWVPQAATPAEAAQAAGIAVPAGAVFRVDGVLWQADKPLPRQAVPPVVQVFVPAKVQFTVDGAPLAWDGFALTLAEALGQAGITLRWADRASVALTSNPARVLAAEITRAAPFAARVGEATYNIYSAAATVGAALAVGNLAPQGLEFTTPADDAAFPKNKTVALHEARESLVLRQLPVAFDSKTQPLPDEPLDTIKVVQEGTYGLQVQRVRVRYVDGLETGRVVEDSWVAVPPKPRIVGYGTKIEIQTLQTPDGPVQCWRVVRVYATSYSPCRVGTGQCSDITFSGAKLHKGIVAVKRSWYAYMGGQKVYVPGYGFGIIADIGGGIPGRHWIDLGFSDDDYESWHQWTTLCFVAPPPPPEQIPWILP